MNHDTLFFFFFPSLSSLPRWRATYELPSIILHLASMRLNPGRSRKHCTLRSRVETEPVSDKEKKKASTVCGVQTRERQYVRAFVGFTPAVQRSRSSGTRGTRRHGRIAILGSRMSTSGTKRARLSSFMHERSSQGSCLADVCYGRWTAAVVSNPGIPGPRVVKLTPSCCSATLASVWTHPLTITHAPCDWQACDCVFWCYRAPHKSGL